MTTTPSLIRPKSKWNQLGVGRWELGVDSAALFIVLLGSLLTPVQL